MPQILIPISPGELIDRLTILEVKSQKLSNSAKCRAVDVEHSTLSDILEKLELPRPASLFCLRAQLRKINLEIWTALEEQRELRPLLNNHPVLEANLRYSQLAQRVTDLNDERAKLKHSIDSMYGCVGEQKSFLPSSAVPVSVASPLPSR